MYIKKLARARASLVPTVHVESQEHWSVLISLIQSTRDWLTSGMRDLLSGTTSFVDSESGILTGDHQCLSRNANNAVIKPPFDWDKCSGSAVENVLFSILSGRSRPPVAWCGSPLKVTMELWGQSHLSRRTWRRPVSGSSNCRINSRLPWGLDGTCYFHQHLDRKGSWKSRYAS